MEEFTNLVAQVQHNPTWNVYLCWLLIFYIINLHFVETIAGVESLSEDEKWEKQQEKKILNGKFTWRHSIDVLRNPLITATVHDGFVFFLNQGELIIVVYNKMFFAQFLSFTTISNFLT